MSHFGWRPYVPVRKRSQQTAKKMEQLRKNGRVITPVVIDGRKITTSFWGTAWCDNLERYSDYENRLPRGRSYVRNGSVIDLQIAEGLVTAMVSGSEIYQVQVKITPLAATRWKAICRDCASSIDSLVELLQGRLSKGVMDRVCQPDTGLFPAPKEITLACSCPDWAGLCKHVAAVLYGVGARLDTQPELLFKLRKVDEKALIASVGKGFTLGKPSPASAKVFEGDDLSALFDLEMSNATIEDPPHPVRSSAKPTAGKRAGAGRRASAKKKVMKKRVGTRTVSTLAS